MDINDITETNTPEYIAIVLRRCFVFRVRRVFGVTALEAVVLS